MNTRAKSDKRIELLKGYVVDINSLNMILKNKIKIVKDSKGNEVEECEIHGYFTNYKSLFKKLSKLLTISKLKKNNNLKEFQNAIIKTDRQIEKLCKMLNED